MNKDERVWVVGGEQRGVPHWTREWMLYKRGVVVKIENGRIERVFEYESPSHHRPDSSWSVVFKSSTIDRGRAYLCTQTEVLICSFPSFEIQKIISYPCFNDLHHVSVSPDGRLFVAVTGLDAVAELSPDGSLLGLTSVLGDSVWDRFSPDIDYRKWPTTKPHRSHPNFVFFLKGHPWVTRFEQHDAVPLSDPFGAERFRLGAQGVHDGHVWGDFIYFTAINGVVWRFELGSEKMQIYDLNEFRSANPGVPLGWCRGILPRAAYAWVGFSRIRYTSFRRNVDWIRRGFRDSELHSSAPTRISRYDFNRRELLDEFDLENAGLNAVFSIHGEWQHELEGARLY